MNRLYKVVKISLDILVPFGPFLRRVENSKPFNGLARLLYEVLPLSFFIYWLFRLLGEYGGLAYLLVLVPISALVHIKEEKYHTKNKIYRTFLWYFIVIIIGFGSIWSFVGHFFLSDSVAQSIGWNVGSPFQIELAFYHLGIGLAGLLCIWFKDSLWAGVVVIKSVFLYGAAYVHIKDIILSNNYAPANTGSVLISDIVFPSILIFLLIIDMRTKPNSISSRTKG